MNPRPSACRAKTIFPQAEGRKRFSFRVNLLSQPTKAACTSIALFGFIVAGLLRERQRSTSKSAAAGKGKPNQPHNSPHLSQA